MITIHRPVKSVKKVKRRWLDAHLKFDRVNSLFFIFPFYLFSRQWTMWEYRSTHVTNPTSEDNWCFSSRMKTNDARSSSDSFLSSSIEPSKKNCSEMKESRGAHDLMSWNVCWTSFHWIERWRYCQIRKIPFGIYRWIFDWIDDHCRFGILFSCVLSILIEEVMTKR